jgi:uncharacterized metal-binding protein/predicted Fe-Mo cluster-binding NifX family protein
MFATRVAPTFLHSDSLLLAVVKDGNVVSREVCETRGYEENARIDLLEDLKAGVLICGGIETHLMDELRARGVETFNNVAGEVDDVLGRFVETGLRPGYGITYRPDAPVAPSGTPDDGDRNLYGSPVESRINCVDCLHRACLRGLPCEKSPEESFVENINGPLAHSLDVTMDIAMEPERILCRVAELVYYCQGMGYGRLGLAFCTDLFPEAEALTQILKRFFDVIPVCCRVGGVVDSEPDTNADFRTGTCNPIGMARVLNRANTDLNVMAGLCMGSDICFTQTSLAPVTTLFVKDRLLANNPIGALHSSYQKQYLMNEI